MAQRGRSEQIRIPAATPEQKSVGKDSDLPPAIAKLSQAADGRRSGHNSEFVPVLGLASPSKGCGFLSRDPELEIAVDFCRLL